MKTERIEPRPLHRFIRADEAVSTLEYAMAVGVMAIAVGVAVVAFGENIVTAIGAFEAPVEQIATQVADLVANSVASQP